MATPNDYLRVDLINIFIVENTLNVQYRILQKRISDGRISQDRIVVQNISNISGLMNNEGQINKALVLTKGISKYLL